MKHATALSETRSSFHPGPISLRQVPPSATSRGDREKSPIQCNSSAVDSATTDRLNGVYGLLARIGSQHRNEPLDLAGTPWADLLAAAGEALPDRSR